MSRASRAEAEYVIVGGGVIGLALAYELSRRGRGVLVLERDRPGNGATAAAGGMLAPVSEAGHGPPQLVELGCELPCCLVEMGCRNDRYVEAQ